jgi:hypothetical protein
MEDLFAPTTRFRDFARERVDDDFDINQQMNRLVELELITGSSVEDTFLHRGYTWSDYFSWARGKMVWISPDVFFDSSGIYTNIWFQTDYRSFLVVRVVPNKSQVINVYARSEAHATVASDILLQLLTTCDSKVVT